MDTSVSILQFHNDTRDFAGATLEPDRKDTKERPKELAGVLGYEQTIPQKPIGRIQDSECCRPGEICLGQH